MSKKEFKVPNIDLGNIYKYQDDFEQIALIENKIIEKTNNSF